jgi:predicted site-specific integrase-resolvase
MPTEMLTAEDVAVTMRISPRTLYRWVEDGRIHFIEQENRILRVCLRSLSLVLEENSEAQES